MSPLIDIWLPLLGGIALLLTGGDLLVRGAVKVAAQLGVSPLVIGLTLVGFGTSMPELVTSVQAALVDAPGIAFGNIVGSNIANTLLIVGASSLIFPLAVTSTALRRDGLVMLAATLAFVGVAATMTMGRSVGVVFISLLAFYIYTAFRQERRAPPDAGPGAVQEKSLALQAADPGTMPPGEAPGRLLVPVLTAVAGLVLVVVGGSVLIDGAVALARSLEISQTVIGLTIVAIGTSLPELVTSILAAVRRQSDVAFGNVIGSNIYNLFGIGGATALIAPSDVPAELVRFDNLVMVAVSIMLVVFAWTGMRIARLEGAILFGAYGLYLYSMWL